MLMIIQCRQSRPLCRGIDIERLAHSLHQVDQLFGADAVSDPESRQSIKLGECPQGQNRFAALVIAQRIWIIRILDIFEVGFIDDD